MSYRDWKEHKDDCVFKNQEVYIELTKEYATKTVEMSERTTMVINSVVLVVSVYRREKEYCQPLECIESRRFGEPTEYNKAVAESFFIAKVGEHLQ